MSACKRRDLSAGDKLGVLNKYDALPQMSQRQAACELNVSQSLLSRLLQCRQEVENAASANDSSNRKRKRGGKEVEVEEALKQWFTKVREKYARVTGPLLRQKAEELAKKMGKHDFVATEGWFHRWKKRENISFAKPHGGQGDAHESARLWIHSEWPALIDQFPPSRVFNADETGLFFKALPEHTYVFKNDKTRGTKISKELLTILCCASMDGEKRRLLAIGSSENPHCFKGVKSLPVDYTANTNAWMTREIWLDWLTKWDNELHHDVLLLADDCMAHAVDVNFKHIKLVFLPANTKSSIQPCDQGIIQAFKAHYRTGMRKKVITVMDAGLEQGSCTLRAHEIANKITVLEGLHLANEAWNEVGEVTIRNCFRHCGFDLSPKEDESPIMIPSDISAECFDEWMSIDEDVITTEVVTEDDICREIQSKRQKEESVTDDDADDEPAEEPPSTKEMLEALQILCQGVQYRGDSDHFRLHQTYEKAIMKLTEGKTESTLDELILRTGSESKEKWINLRNAFVKTLKRPASGDSARMKKPYYLSEAVQFALPIFKVSGTTSGNLPELVTSGANVADVPSPEGSTVDEFEDQLEPQSPPPHPSPSTTPRSSSPSIGSSHEDEEQSRVSTNRKREAVNSMVADKHIAEYFSAKKRYVEAKQQPNVSGQSEALKMFLLSLIPDIQALPPSQIRAFKRRTLALIDELSDAGEPSTALPTITTFTS